MQEWANRNHRQIHSTRTSQERIKIQNDLQPVSKAHITEPRTKEGKDDYDFHRNLMSEAAKLDDVIRSSERNLPI